ncbi:MAG TPA: stage IV sporulation protein A [Clostridiales bacterium]|nr:stage IV sporulation protein A [Clostridiales bacterium]
MDKFDLYNDIATRTNGDIYIGVVGPVRTGKSTFIKRFMENLILPEISDENDRVRATDEMPQSAAGRIVMTTQPKFVPADAIKLSLGEIRAKIRLIDCVGYMVEGAEGGVEDGKPRMVRTPWSDGEIPFEEAAEIGTEKVIRDHSTIGVVVTQDGTVTEIPRASYIAAEERVVNEMKGIGKPFVMILNSKAPASEETEKLRFALSERYGVTVISKDLMKMGEADFREILEKVLLEFPIKSVDFTIPDWMRALGEDDGILGNLFERIKEGLDGVEKMRDVSKLASLTAGSEYFTGCRVESVDASCGKATVGVSPAENLFYKVLSEVAGKEIDGEYGMMTYVRYLSKAGAAYEKLKDALADVKEKGYGVVAPGVDEMVLEEPEIFKTGGKCGVKLKASAPSIHIMRVDVNTEVNPIVGTEQQGEEMVKYLMSEFETDKKGIWETDFFGKSLNELVREDMASKLGGIPEDAQNKVRRTLGKMVNEGRGGMICILL